MQCGMLVAEMFMCIMKTKIRWQKNHCQSEYFMFNRPVRLYGGWSNAVKPSDGHKCQKFLVCTKSLINLFCVSLFHDWLGHITKPNL